MNKDTILTKQHCINKDIQKGGYVVVKHGRFVGGTDNSSQVYVVRKVEGRYIYVEHSIYKDMLNKTKPNNPSEFEKRMFTRQELEGVLASNFVVQFLKLY